MLRGPEWIIILGICAACAVASGHIASKKGYSYNVYALLGLLLGVIGLIIAAVIPDKSMSAGSNEALGAEALAKYKELLDKGAITQEEFDKKKSELL